MAIIMFPDNVLDTQGIAGQTGTFVACCREDWLVSIELGDGRRLEILRRLLCPAGPWRQATTR